MFQFKAVAPVVLRQSDNVFIVWMKEQYLYLDSSVLLLVMGFTQNTSYCIYQIYSKSNLIVINDYS